MKTNRVVEWTMASGKRCEIKIEVERAMVENGTSYADGWDVKLSGKHLVEDKSVIAYVDGVEIERAYLGMIRHVTPIVIQGQTIVAGISRKIGLTQEHLDMIETAVASATAEAETDHEVMVIREQQAASREADRKYEKHHAAVERMMNM